MLNYAIDYIDWLIVMTLFVIVNYSSSRTNLYLFVGACLSIILNFALKEFIFRPLYKGTNIASVIGPGERPSTGICKINPKISYGMPSGHSQFIWFIATLLIMILTVHGNTSYKYIIIPGIIALAMYVSYSRIHVSECHYTNQVIVGAILGIISGLLYDKLVIQT